MINKAGASFIIGICNPVDNVGKYMTEKAKAVNLGIYGADLAYSTTYQMKQETMNFLKVCKQLVEELNINAGFTPELALNVEKNINNKDSLIVIFTNSYYETYRTLVQNQKESLSLLVVAGSWIEGVYITSQIALTSRDNTEFIKILANQKAPLGKLMELMTPRVDIPEVKELMDMLAPIQAIYNKVEQYPAYVQLLIAQANASALTATDKIIFTPEGSTPTIVVPGPGIMPTVDTTP